MLPRVVQFLNTLKAIERNILQIFGGPPKEFALAYVHERPAQEPSSPKKFSIKDVIGDGLLLAVPKFRRTVEKRLKRKFGHKDYVYHILLPKNNIKVCYQCGHHHESGRLCGNCYKKIEEETKLIQERIKEELGYCKPIENDVIVLYDGEKLPDEITPIFNKIYCFFPIEHKGNKFKPSYINLTDAALHQEKPVQVQVRPQPKEFWRGKRIIEMKKERPQWFSKNLLQKTTQQPSKSTDVKPTDLA